MKLSVEHITVSKSGLTIEVMCLPRDAKVTAEQAAQVIELLPNLSRHVCVNERGDTFGDEVVGTEPAHLLEHVVIELMAQAHGSGKGLMGHTSFTDERGLMLVKLTFKDDLIALSCVKQAVSIINSLEEEEADGI